MPRLSLVCCSVVVALFVATASARAEGPGIYFGAVPYHYSRAVVRDKIPYFAENPPVYYSYVVPRPYGWSPYPYPYGYPMPEMAPAEPPAPLETPAPLKPSRYQAAVYQAGLLYGARR